MHPPTTGEGASQQPIDEVQILMQGVDPNQFIAEERGERLNQSVAGGQNKVPRLVDGVEPWIHQLGAGGRKEVLWVVFLENDLN